MSSYEESRRQADESFRRAQSAYENDTGFKSGEDKVICQMCGNEFHLRWIEENGQGECLDDQECPECGWPVAQSNKDQCHYEPGPYEETEYQAPCPVCGKIVVPKGETPTMYDLQCGHWVEIEAWMDYAAAYDRFDENSIGLPDNALFSAFSGRYPSSINKEKRLS